ncbi:MAG: hypothetical protein JWL70_2914, partial [Acidimicrobiia bacterium]|nr:hypothetical protein [Acidimicrobiia bacterium]
SAWQDRIRVALGEPAAAEPLTQPAPEAAPEA